MRHKASFCLTDRHSNLLPITLHPLCLASQDPQKVHTTKEVFQQEMKFYSRVGDRIRNHRQGWNDQGEHLAPQRAGRAFNQHAAELHTQLNFNWWVYL